MTSRFIWRTALVAMLLMPALAQAQVHCSQLPELSVNAQFPRCSEQQLASAGFPDHKHAHHWRDWRVLVDEAGNPYGPGSMCDRKTLIEREDVEVLEGEIRFGPFIMLHNPGYKACDMLPFVELLDWANHVVPELLGLSAPGPLTVLNPDKTQHYLEQTGQGVWRLYQLKGNEATIEPYPVLNARTLDAHAAFMLITDWILHQSLDQDLPTWLHQGLIEYISEDGTHLANYMAEFRGENSILLSAPLVDAILGRGIDPDEGTDRENFRRARYSAFLMVWQLVEFEGGLEALQDFLAQAASGADLDEAARMVYGMDLVQLADLTDAARNGEPAGQAAKRTSPHVQP